MTQSSVLTLALATAVLPQLQAALEESSGPCVSLHEQVSALVARFLTAPITPASTLDFETSLQQVLAECGRLVVQAAFNHIEPEDPQDAPKHSQRDRQGYARKNAKSRNLAVARRCWRRGGRPPGRRSARSRPGSGPAGSAPGRPGDVQTCRASIPGVDRPRVRG